MASYYSILHDYGSPQQPYDFNLIQSGLQLKQNKYDVNHTAVQQQIDEIANIDLLRDVDKEYLINNLKGLVSEINKVGELDLSKNGVVLNFKNHIKQAIDDNVLNAYVGTKAVRDYQKTVDWFKKNKPEQYSPQNESFGYLPVNEWLSDPTPGKAFKGTTYIPYVDVLGKSKKVLENLYKNSKDKIVIPEVDKNGKPTGRMIEKEWQGLTPTEVESVFKGMLDPSSQKQMEINAWSRFMQNPELTNELFDRHISRKRKELENYYKVASKSGNKKQMEMSKLQLEQFDTKVNSLDTVNSKALFLEEENTIGGLQNIYMKRRVNLEYNEDAAFWKSRDLELKQAELVYKKNKNSSSKGDSISNYDNNGVPTGVSVDIYQDNIESTKINKKELFFKDIATTKNTSLTLADKLLSGDLKELKADIITESKYISEELGVDTEKAKLMAVSKYLETHPGLAKTDDAVNFLVNYKKFKAKVEEAGKIENKIAEEVSKTIDDKIGLIYDLGNGAIKEKYESFLGVKLPDTPNELTEEERKGIKYAMAVDNLVNILKGKKDPKDLNIWVKYINKLTGKKIDVDIKSISNLKETLNAQGDIARGAGFSPVGWLLKGLSFTNPVRIYDDVKGDEVNFSLKGDNNIINDINRAISLKMYDDKYLKLPLEDRSISTDSDFKRDISSDRLNKRYDELIEDTLGVEVGNTGLTFSSVVTKGELKYTPVQRGIFETIQKGVNDPNTYIENGFGNFIPLNQLSENAKKNYLSKLKVDKKTSPTVLFDKVKDGYTTISVNGVKLLVRDNILVPSLQKYGINPDLLSKDRDQIYVKMSMESEEAVSFEDKNYKAKKIDFYKKYLKPTELPALTSDGFKLSLYQNIPVLSDQDKSGIDFIVDNSEKLRTFVNIHNGNIVYGLKNKDGEVIYDWDISSSKFPNLSVAQKQYEYMLKKQTVAPQVFLYNILKDMLLTEKLNIYSTKTLQGLIKNIQQ